MMNRILPVIISGLAFLTGCSTSQQIVKHSPSVPMKNYDSIAIAKFVSPEPAIGQRASERLTVKFAEAGYKVTRHEKLKKLSGKDVLTSPDLSKTDMEILQANGIKAVLYGTIDRYECRNSTEWSWTGYAPEKVIFEVCSASLAIKVADAADGRTVWQTRGSYSQKAPDITARMAFERVLTAIEEEIPKIDK